MEKLIVTLSFFCGTVAFAQENRISTNQIDTLPTPTAVERTINPSIGEIEAAKRRSTSEIDAEMRSKSKTESKANSKPNPYNQPLIEPTPPPTAGSGTTKTVNTPKN